MGYAGNFFAAAEAVPLGKVAKPQALTEGVSYYNMYYFSLFFSHSRSFNPHSCTIYFIFAQFMVYL